MFRQVYSVGYATSLISLITAIVVLTAFRYDSEDDVHLNPTDNQNIQMFSSVKTCRILKRRIVSLYSIYLSKLEVH